MSVVEMGTNDFFYKNFDNLLCKKLSLANLQICKIMNYNYENRSDFEEDTGKIIYMSDENSIKNNIENNEEENVELKPNLRLRLIIFFIGLFCIFLIRFICINNTLKYKIGNYKVTVLSSKIKINRKNYQYSSLKNGNILITGGLSDNNIPLNTTEIIDTKNNLNTLGPIMNIPHINHKQFSLKSGKIVIADQNGFETYDNSKKSFHMWNSINIRDFLGIDKNETIIGESYVLLPNDNILITGGYLPKEKKYLNTAFIADTQNEKIRQISDMPNAITNHIARVSKGKVYLFSGYSDYINKTLIYDIESEKFYKSNLDFSSFHHMICFPVKEEELCMHYNRQFCEKVYRPFDYPIPQNQKKYSILNLKKETVNNLKYPFKGLKIYNGQENEIGMILSNGDIFIIGNDCNTYKYIIYSIEQRKFYEVKIPKNLYGNIIKTETNKALIHTNKKIFYNLIVEP